MYIKCKNERQNVQPIDQLNQELCALNVLCQSRDSGIINHKF